MEENKGILLESGTNEFEFIEFSVGDVHYGINVAKVREIINYPPVTPIANSHPFVSGIFTLRGKVISMVDLAKSLSSSKAGESKKAIVTEMNGVFTGFEVDEVYRIHRVSWKQMEPAPELVGSEHVVGIVQIGEKMIILIDFEKILSDINVDMNKKMTTIPVSTGSMVDRRKTKTILVAEDSRMLREILLGTLHTAGYNTIAFENGQLAWDKLAEFSSGDKPVADRIQMVITDIEMPQMDGHHLLKRIKDDRNLRDLPVVIFSSLINPEMKRKGEGLGAYAQVTKPEIEQLIGIIDKKLVN